MEMHLFTWTMVILISMIWAKMVCLLHNLFYVITLGVVFFAEKHNWVKKS